VLWVYNLISFLYVCTVSNMQHINDWMSTKDKPGFVMCVGIGGDVVNL